MVTSHAITSRLSHHSDCKAFDPTYSCGLVPVEMDKKASGQGESVVGAMQAYGVKLRMLTR